MTRAFKKLNTFTCHASHPGPLRGWHGNSSIIYSEERTFFILHRFFQKNIFTAQLSDPSPKPSYSSGGWPFCPLPPIGPIDFWLEAAAAPVSKLQKAAVVSVEAVAKTSSGSQTS